MKKKKSNFILQLIKKADTMKTDRFYAIIFVMITALIMWRIEYFVG